MCVSLLLFGTVVCQAAPPAAPKVVVTAPAPRVIMETTQGKIILELFPDKAPQTVKNFLEYVNAKFYNDTIFHRVIANFMIQGGGVTEDLQKKKTRAPVVNEANNGVRNTPGTRGHGQNQRPPFGHSSVFHQYRRKHLPGLQEKERHGLGLLCLRKSGGGQ